MKKHDVNTKKGTLINFQIALIALFSFIYVMHEVYNYKPLKNKKITTINLDDDATYLSFSAVNEIPNRIAPLVEKKEITKKVIQPKKIITPQAKPIETKNTIEEPQNEIVKNKPNTIETTINYDKGSTNTKNNSTTKSAIKNKLLNKNVVYNHKTVDVLPVFPGCAKYKTNDERAECFQLKVQRLINRKFNKSIGYNSNEKTTQRINLYFEIDKNGEVTNIKATNKHKVLTKEAERVAKNLPKMQPAKSGNKNVKMAYNVPIIFRPAN